MILLTTLPILVLLVVVFGLMISDIRERSLKRTTYKENRLEIND